MSYFVTIDEMPEMALRRELTIRRRRRDEGRCDYCGRGPDTDPCKFAERHTDPRIKRPT